MSSPALSALVRGGPRRALPGGLPPFDRFGGRLALALTAALALAAGCHRDRGAPAGKSGATSGTSGVDPALARGRKMVSEAAACEAGGSAAPAHCEAACALNHSNSCARSGQWREKASDMKHAMAFYMKACDGGSGLGCEEAARVRGAGKDGAPADPARAAALYHKARFYHRVHCQQGFAPSCLNLGRMFLDGRGGPADRSAAGYFLDRACNMGVKDACGVVAHP